MAGRALRRVVAPTAATAAVTSVTAVTINFATEWQSNLWAWLAVAVATALVAAVALWRDHRSTDAAGPSDGEGAGGQVVHRARIDGDNIQIGRARDVNIDRRCDQKK